MTIDLNLVPVFLAVAEEGNFRAAADRLGVTTLGRKSGNQTLEDICGIALVSRTTRSVRLTEAGNRLHENPVSANGRGQIRLRERGRGRTAQWFAADCSYIDSGTISFPAR